MSRQEERRLTCPLCYEEFKEYFKHCSNEKCPYKICQTCILNLIKQAKLKMDLCCSFCRDKISQYIES